MTEQKIDDCKAVYSQNTIKAREIAWRLNEKWLVSEYDLACAMRASAILLRGKLLEVPD